jgi:hypothetical protein
MTKMNHTRGPSIAASCALALFTAGSASAVTSNAFANGSFETIGTTTPAASWLPAAAGYTISNDAKTGNNAALLQSPELNAAIFQQNSVADGGQPTLVVGEIASFSFWAKGNVSGTGNIGYRLDFQDGGGAPVYSSGRIQFQSSLNTSTYTQIVLPDVVIPTGASSAFLLIDEASGPFLGTPGNILIDDIVLSTVPEPSAVVLLGSGLGLLTLRRRRR